MNKMDKPVIVINGTGGSGKDSFVSLCYELTHGRILNISSVDKVKEAANILIGYELKSKSEKNRKLWHDLKKLSIEYCDAPLHYIVKQIGYFIKHDDYKLMFIHIREGHEINKLKVATQGLCEIKTLLIKNPNVPDIISNDSDKFVESYAYDHILKNNGTFEDLLNSAKIFLNNLELRI